MVLQILLIISYMLASYLLLRQQAHHTETMACVCVYFPCATRGQTAVKHVVKVCHYCVVCVESDGYVHALDLSH